MFLPRSRGRICGEDIARMLSICDVGNALANCAMPDRFITQRLTDGGDPKFQPMAADAFGSPHQQVVMPLFTVRDGNFVPVGTGFVVGGDGLMMTASHVVLEAAAAAGHVVRDEPQDLQGGELYALYVSDEKHGPNNEHFVGGLWPVQKSWCDCSLDIGWCWLQRAERDGKPVLFRRMRLSPGLPKVGDEITAFGYHGLSEPMKTGADGKRVVTYDQKGSFTTGRIIEIHAERRDSSMLRFPCFRTDARFDPGMSGGPVVNKEGSVCGVICSSLGVAAGEEGYISYASLVWPVLGTEIEVAPAEGKPVRATKIEELVRSGYIATDGTETQIRVQTAPGANTVVSITTM